MPAQPSARMTALATANSTTAMTATAARAMTPATMTARTPGPSPPQPLFETVQLPWPLGMSGRRLRGDGHAAPEGVKRAHALNELLGAHSALGAWGTKEHVGVVAFQRRSALVEVLFAGRGLEEVEDRA